MSDHLAYEPDERADAWLRSQIAAAAGPRDIAEMSDAQLETMLDACGDGTYSLDQLERQLARFWIEVSQPPATNAIDQPTGESVDAAQPLAAPSLHLQPPQEQLVTPAAASQTPTLPKTPSFVDEPNEGPLLVSVRRTAGFFSEYTPLLCLAAAIVAGFFLVGHWPTSRRTEVAISGPLAALPSERQPIDVGHISGMIDCSFAAGRQPAVQQKVKVGQRLELNRGLLEITYNGGDRIILQGPATYTVESDKGGFLSAGKLTAIVEDDLRVPDSKFPSKSSTPKFVLGTPSVTVNDLGTEFGVEVKPDRVIEVCVFRGEVETVTDVEAGFAPNRERLVTGEAIRFDSNGPPRRTTVQSMGTASLASPGNLLMLTRDARQSQLLAPAGLVATAYHRVWDAHGNLVALGDRRQALQVASDGIFGRGEWDEGPRSSFDTLAATDPQTDFVGLSYAGRVRIDRIKVFMGHQFGDGGSWRNPPRVFVLVNPVGPGSAPPETNPADWRELPPLQLSYGTPFNVAADANPGEVLEFVLTSYPARHRTGYGWAIGGVKGNGEAGYVSITELRAYGTQLD